MLKNNKASDIEFVLHAINGMQKHLDMLFINLTEFDLDEDKLFKLAQESRTAWTNVARLSTSAMQGIAPKDT